MALIWITGLCGSGKTTLASRLTEQFLAQGSDCVHLDGDNYRRSHEPTLGYSRSERLRCAESLTRHCAKLAPTTDQVIVSTISLFHKIHALNRRLHPYYLEVLLRVDHDVLVRRQPPPAERNGPWVGADLAAEYPTSPDLTLSSNSHDEIESNMRRILDALAEREPH